MKNLIRLIPIAFIFILTSCFNHDDQMTISKSGNISVISTIQITDDELEKETIEDEVSKIVDDLKDEGWAVSYKWKKKKSPYRIEFISSNSLKKMFHYQQEYGTASGINVLKNFSDEQYVVSFEKLENADNRSIHLSSSSLSLHRLEDDDEVTEVRDVVGNGITDFYYYIMLD